MDELGKVLSQVVSLDHLTLGDASYTVSNIIAIADENVLKANVCLTEGDKIVYTVAIAIKKISY